MTAARHIHAERQGTGDRLILLHGWTMRGAMMAPLAQALAARFECLAPDLPGHGATRGYSADMAGAVAMLDDLLADGPPVVLVGWSLGALIGWEWLAHHAPGRICGMVSLDMSPCPLPGPDWDYGMLGQDGARIRARAGWFRDGWPSAVAPLAGGIFAPEADPALVRAAAGVIGAQDGATMAGFWASLVECDCRAGVRQLSVPLLAIHGAQSRVYPPASADWLAGAAPRGAARILPGAGHAPHLERPAETAGIIADFATKVLAQ